MPESGAPLQVGPHDLKTNKLHLPSLISDEFGVSQVIAREQIELGMVEIDGEPYEGADKINIPVGLVQGKTITVKGRDRSFRVTYRN